MTPRKWEKILITEEMKNAITELLAHYPDLGYTNHHEFGRAAVRWFMKQIEKDTGINPGPGESAASEKGAGEP